MKNKAELLKQYEEFLDSYETDIFGIMKGTREQDVFVNVSLYNQNRLFNLFSRASVDEVLDIDKFMRNCIKDNLVKCARNMQQYLLFKGCKVCSKNSSDYKTFINLGHYVFAYICAECVQSIKGSEE